MCSNIPIGPLLKDRYVLNTSSASSDTIFVRGITKATLDEEVTTLLSIKAVPLEVDLSQRGLNGGVWAKYASSEQAFATILDLHQRWHRTSCISARYELGIGPDGNRRRDPSTHNTKRRCIHSKSDCGGHSGGYNYTSESVTVNGVDYPFPSGTYLSRVIFLTSDIPATDPLLKILTDPVLGNKYAKEVSEAMAMSDAVERAIKIVHHKNAHSFENAEVFVLGDGVRPLCAACLCLQLPSSWRFHSIDPLLQPIDVGPYQDRFFQHRCLSEDFIIPTKSIDTLYIVVACHSHAPLDEFIYRTPRPVLVVSMPCCADYSNISDEMPLLSFDDFEVYSPKRKVHIYHLNEDGLKKVEVDATHTITE